MSTSKAVKDKPGTGPKQVTIHIEKEIFKIEGDSITAEALRALPEPDIGPDRDLYLETTGPGEDDLIEPHTSVKLKNGLHFFTAPAAINPGHAS